MKLAIDLALPSAPARDAVKCDYINLRGELCAQAQPDPTILEAPTRSELEGALGTAVTKCEFWKKNGRNRLYRVYLLNGEVVVAKQDMVGGENTTQYQYDQLGALAELKIPGLRLPRALGVIPGKRTFVMEFVRGCSLKELFQSGAKLEQLIAMSELSGQILARLHSEWTEQIAPFPVEQLALDLAAAPWSLSSSETKILSDALHTLSRARVSVGPVWYDYQPKNLLYEKGEICLIDPPDVPWQGIHLWDYARFRSGLRRMFWRQGLRKPWKRANYALLHKTLADGFERGYIERMNKQDHEPAFFAAISRLLELQHTGMSMANVVEMNRAQKQKSISRILRVARTRFATLPLLELEKRSLIRQLARELP